MGVQLVVEESARLDLLGIVRTISSNNPAAAQKLKEDIVRQIGLLREFPQLGPVSRDEGLRKRGYRILTAGNYLVFYRLEGKMVRVIKVLHGARMYRHLLPE